MRPGLGPRALQFLRSGIRFDEVLVLQGTPILGALFAMGRPTLARVLALAPFVAGSSCLVAHVFVLNDWAGMSADLKDPHRGAGVFAARGVDARAMARLSAALLAAALALLCPFGARTVGIALAIAGLSALYSLSGRAAKGVPVLSSLLHVVGGILHFHLGYSLFATFDSRSLALSVFFAFVFTAGHLTQEARDYDADRLNAIRTNAVAFGRPRAFLAGVALFTLANVLLFGLAARGVIPRVLMTAAVLYPLHLWWSLAAWRAGLGFETLRRLQHRYRALYAAVGLLILAAIV